NLKAKTKLLQYQAASTPQLAADEAITIWLEMIHKAEGSPLFPIESFCDQLSILTPVLGMDENFMALTDKADKLLAARSGASAVGHKSRDRAMVFYREGNYLHAVKHLHQTKINWHTKETLRGC